ncbi:hypothetical protein VTK73DRAFT_625 [Phialemonium thermophilum]|uniref:Aminoglycoside phosphotransferase domain-containing protein n=1 Tax=Phialemonium thermophilum TaxID=223376 RepID=A0ABR3VUM7_9PEZI
MTPPITDSLRRLQPHVWIVGSSVLCEKVAVVPDGVLASWNDRDGSHYCLRPIDDAACEQAASGPYAPLHSAGTSGAVWVLGGALCKAKAWVDGIETEAETLGFVRKTFDVLVPEVLYEWIDRKASRSFLLKKRVEGTTLQQAWPSLSHHQRRDMAEQVARYCETLAEVTFDSLESVTGRGIQDHDLLPDRPAGTPSWRPIPFPRLSKAEAQVYLAPMDAGETFYFCHVDLNPTNVMILHGRVTGIIDWESAAFYPRIWVGTKARVSYGFILEDVDGDQWAWSKLLSEAVQKRNLSSDVHGFSVFYRRLKPACHGRS